MTVQTPASTGFAMPAEWVRHARTWMAWPCRQDLWGAKLADAQASYAKVASTIAQFEPVIMVANDGDVAQARRLCGRDVQVISLPIDDSWMRDSGPTFVRNAAGEIAGIDWGFNAWGGKFPPWDNDALVAGRMLSALSIPAFKTPFILEGGSFHVDGEGTVLTTEQCLLNPNRNPDFSRAQIEAQLNSWLGANTIIWLGEGLENDHTDGHIDDIACFVRPGVVMAAVCGDPADPNHAPLEDNLRRLASATDAKGRSLDIIKMPLPSRRIVPGVGRLASSYVNFYFANGAVVAPSFDDPADAAAEAILKDAFPDRQIVMVPCQTIIEGGGSIHCITQQQPAGAPAKGLRP